MIITHPIKYGFTRQLAVDIGGGDHVGITYSVSDPLLISCNSTGEVGVLSDPAQMTIAYVYATDTEGEIRAVIDVQVFPSSVDIESMLYPTGKPKSLAASLDLPSVVIVGDSNAFIFGGTVDITFLASGTNNVENYIFAVPGTKGTTPALMSNGRYVASAAGNHQSAFHFGGWDANASSGGVRATNEHYIFATPGTKGSAPADLSMPKHGTTAVGNQTQCFLFAGQDGAASGNEQYIYATPSTKGTAPVQLTFGRGYAAAIGDATKAIVIGGNRVDGEHYIFATPGTKGTAPADLDFQLYNICGASNLTVGFIFGGRYSTTPVSSCAQYVFASLGTRGTDPASLSHTRHSACAAGSKTSALVLGGVYDNECLDTGETYLFATPGTKGTTPAVMTLPIAERSAAANRTFNY
jgi:hypothetical protein